MAQIQKIRLPDGRVLTPGDWTSAEPLYTAIDVGAGPINTLYAFSYGIGGDIPGSPGPARSDYRWTNLEGQGAMLPENEELIVWNFCVSVFQMGTTDDGAADNLAGMFLPVQPDVGLFNLLRLQRDTVCFFRIANVKDYTVHPLGYFPASTGVEQVNANAQDPAGLHWVAGNNGGTNVADVRTLASPLYVAGGESFGIDFRFPAGQIEGLSFGADPAAADARLRLRIFLDGYRRRPVA